jgi:regulatory protein
MDLAKVRNYALRLLRYCPRSQREIEERLKRKKYPPELIRKVVGEFLDTGLIDDKAFVKFWFNWRNEINPRSQNFIRLELRQKGISEDIIQEIVGVLPPANEILKAKELAQKRYDRLKNIEPEKRKRRLYAYLQRRGFEQGIIWDVLNNLIFYILFLILIYEHR